MGAVSVRVVSVCVRATRASASCTEEDRRESVWICPVRARSRERGVVPLECPTDREGFDYLFLFRIRCSFGTLLVAVFHTCPNQEQGRPPSGIDSRSEEAFYHRYMVPFCTKDVYIHRPNLKNILRRINRSCGGTGGADRAALWGRARQGLGAALGRGGRLRGRGSLRLGFAARGRAAVAPLSMLPLVSHAIGRGAKSGSLSTFLSPLHVNFSEVSDFSGLF